ncbi:MAG: GGDEF domain-containing protein [Candidatus Nanopelagicales bacterium]
MGIRDWIRYDRRIVDRHPSILLLVDDRLTVRRATGMARALLGPCEGRAAAQTLNVPEESLRRWLDESRAADVAPFHLARATDGTLIAVRAFKGEILEVHRLQPLEAGWPIDALVVTLTDALTGVLTRRALDMWAGDIRLQDRACFLLLNLDRLSQVNDTHGFTAGDTLIAAIARDLIELSGPESLVFRLGGDEFLVVLAAPLDRASAVAHALVEKSRRRVAGSGTAASTVSIGVARDRGDSDVYRALQRVDRLMYRARVAGGDRVAVEGDDGEDSESALSPSPR